MHHLTVQHTSYNQKQNHIFFNVVKDEEGGKQEAHRSTCVVVVGAEVKCSIALVAV